MSVSPAAPASGIRRPCYLVLSAHDFRTPRRANIHFITDQLALRGTTRFFVAIQQTLPHEGRYAPAAG